MTRITGVVTAFLTIVASVADAPPWVFFALIGSCLLIIALMNLSAWIESYTGLYRAVTDRKVQLYEREQEHAPPAVAHAPNPGRGRHRKRGRRERRHGT